MIDLGGSWAHNEPCELDLETIERAYGKDPLYEKQVEEPALGNFNLKSPKEFFTSKSQVDWLVDNLLYRGGVSVIVGAPKSGKSTLTRQMALSVCRGEKFLGRGVKKGKVLYLALEEQEQMLQGQFRRIGLNENDDIMIHVGSIFTEDRDERLKEIVNETQPDLVVIDTLFLFADADQNNYNEVNVKLQKYRDIARASNCHIIFVHHQNKGDDKGTRSISGSQAIHGGVDCALILNRDRKERSIMSSQRGGIELDHICIYNEEKDTYSLGERNF